MTVTVNTSVESAVVEQARLDLIADTLPYVRLQIPLWTGIALFGYSGILPLVSPGLTPGLIAWAGLQLLVVLAMQAAMTLWPRGQAVGLFGIPRRTAYTAVYGLAGLTWGLMAFAVLEPGRFATEASVGAVLVGVVAVNCARLAPHPIVYLAAIVGITIAAVPAFLLQGSDTGLLIGLASPFWTVMLAIPALQLSRRMGEMIETRLQNEKLLASVAAARDEAEAASRAKSAFLANMSHELRTPLNAILGFSDVMKDALFGELAPRYRDYAADIHGSGSHLLALINDLLDIAKIEAGRMQVTPQPVDVEEELSQVARLLQPKAREKRQTIQLALELAPDEVMVDARAFKQIAFNLAGNAVKFTQGSGTIEIGLRDEAGDAVLWVRDNGPGIAAEKLERLFRPFERVDNAYSGAHGGTGLGLALVKALAGLHGGAVEIASEVGEGTTVTVRFPAAVVPRVAAAALAA